MGRTRFSELAGDAFAAGGAARGMDTKTIGSLYSYGRVIDFHNTSDAASFAAAGGAATASWGITLIGASTVTFLPTAGSNPGMRFTFHNAGAANLGGDLIFADVGTGSVGVHPPPLRFSAAAAGSYEPESYVEMCIRKGTVGTGAWTGGLHHMLWGIVPQAPGSTLLDVNGDLVQTTNIAAFKITHASGVLTALAAGASGGAVTIAQTTFTDTTLNGKYLLFGIRVIGLTKVEFYLNRRLLGRGTLANAITGNPYTFGVSAVTGSAGADRVVDIAYIAYGGIRRTAEFLPDRDASDQV